MVQCNAFYRKRTLDFSDKYRNLEKFTTDVEHFLEEFDKIVEYRSVYRTKYHRHLKEIQSNLELLKSKFEQIDQEDNRNQLFKQLFCCGVLFEDCVDLREHYFRFHYTPRLVHPNIVELESGHGKLEHFRCRLEEYLHYGTECSAVLLVNLKKLLNRLNHTMLVDELAKKDHEDKPDYLIYKWREYRAIKLVN
ncbi:uncharacterized protein LOC131681343 [Topomyia yanbarensis]|uniref:uncharacterized protein LOC131681343 n=1 Tax=Topomyia yanbarensis TaxID=2498891 RepID=UPI00273A99D6|nr:uncharacterized protein LOC131681343 [Topomyia yanbarensis]